MLENVRTKCSSCFTLQIFRMKNVVRVAKEKRYSTKAVHSTKSRVPLTIFFSQQKQKKYKTLHKMADDDQQEPSSPTSKSEDELRKARLRAAKLKAKAKAQKSAEAKPKPAEEAAPAATGDAAEATPSGEASDKPAAADKKSGFDLKGKKRFEVKKWNAVALWAWGMFFFLQKYYNIFMDRCY